VFAGTADLGSLFVQCGNEVLADLIAPWPPNRFR